MKILKYIIIFVIIAAVIISVVWYSNTNISQYSEIQNATDPVATALNSEEQKALKEAQEKYLAEEQLSNQAEQKETAADPRPSKIEDQSDKPASFKNNEISIDYYDVEKDRIANITVPADKSSDLSAPLKNALQSVFGNEIASQISTNYIYLDSGSLFIDFTSDIYNISLGTNSEGQLLESIANAYLDNMKDVNSIYYSVDGKDYATGHFEFSKNTPYKTK